MDSTVSITFRYLPGEYVRAIRAHQRTRMRLVMDGIISTLALAISLLAFMSGRRDVFWLGVALFAVGLALPLLLAVFYFILPRMLTSTRFDGDYEMTFSDDGIHFRATAVDSRIGWSLYHRAIVTRDFYLLYRRTREFTVIPKRAFASAADMQVFDRLLAAHVAKIKRN
jgi:YcxB-like protein